MRNRYNVTSARAIAIERRRQDSNAHRSLLLKLGLLLAGILVFTLAGTYSAGAEQVFPKNLALPNGVQPEGIATGRGTDFFVGSLAQGKPLDEAVRYAAIVGALAVTKLGAQTSLPTLAEVNQRIQ